jgi:putative redox protein
MEKHTITANWLGGRAFEGNVGGHRIVVDTPVEKGGGNLGPSPKQLMLLSLAGCTGIDIAIIASKMKLDVTKLEITVEGELTEEHPRFYRRMHVVYEFTGKDLRLDKLQKAVELSEEKYCGVSAVYKKVVEMSSEIRIIPE